MMKHRMICLITTTSPDYDPECFRVEIDLFNKANAPHMSIEIEDVTAIPDTETGQPKAMAQQTREQAEQEFAEWVKPDILAEIIFEELDSAEIPATFENAKKVYLDILEDRLYEAIKVCLEFSPEFAKYREGLEPVPTPS